MAPNGRGRGRKEKKSGRPALHGLHADQLLLHPLQLGDSPPKPCLTSLIKETEEAQTADK
jgi:hypothetical protein